MSDDLSRRSFIKKTGIATLGLSSLTLPSHLFAENKVRRPYQDGRKLGVALVGLGSYSRGQLAPGLQQTEHCELRGIVTGSPEKIPEWQDQYGIPDSNVYNYDNMHEIADNDDIDIVYVVVPTGLHAKYSIIAAEAGKHVWCEKPMAMNVEECQAMIDAMQEGKQLAIGYRLQHEPNNQAIMSYAIEEPFGAVTNVKAGAGYDGYHGDGNWRKNAELGGGALYDMGVYCVNALRYATGLEPVAARGIQSVVRKDVYTEVDEMTRFELQFENRMTCFGETAFGKSVNYLEANYEDGWAYLKPYQSYTGVNGKVSDGTVLPEDPNDQQARQMDQNALAIKQNEPNIAPGEEGLKDIRIINTIMESSKNGGEWVEL